MTESLLVEILKLIPSLGWIVLGALALCLFHRSIRDSVIPRLSTFKAFGVEASFVKEALDKVSQESIAGDERSKSSVARRAERISSIVTGAKVLVVNDNPGAMSPVTEILQSMRIVVTVAIDTEQALRFLGQNTYDVVLSDMKRGAVENEGIIFLNRAMELGIHRPTILTVARYDPGRGTPAYAFAITNRIDEMLHYIFDILERGRLPRVEN